MAVLLIDRNTGTGDVITFLQACREPGGLQPASDPICQGPGGVASCQVRVAIMRPQSLYPEMPREQAPVSLSAVRTSGTPDRHRQAPAHPDRPAIG